MKTFIVVIDDFKLAAKDANFWCLNRFGSPALKYEKVTPKYKWAVHNGMENTILYEFLYEDDATLFKLSWL